MNLIENFTQRSVNRVVFRNRAGQGNFKVHDWGKVVCGADICRITSKEIHMKHISFRQKLFIAISGNGDGIGDLQGIISWLDYLKELGVDIVWLSPIYKSPFVDQGYDIADYYAIAEEFGTMEEFDELLAEAKKRDMYIIMDLVINHCSDQHEWFQKALANPKSEYADYFYFREGKNGNPPSNYRSYFGGSCWEPVPRTDLFYFHMFAKKRRT